MDIRAEEISKIIRDQIGSYAVEVDVAEVGSVIAIGDGTGSANSPAAPPDRSMADPENTKLERQLDEPGRSTARAMGEAFRTLRIPVGDVLSSPTYRARQTVRFASFGEPRIRAELDEGAQGMQAAAEATRSDWLRTQAGTAPRPGTNTIIVTHTPNIVGAFQQSGANVAAGESLVFRPDGKGGATLVARVKIADWPGLERQ